MTSDHTLILNATYEPMRVVSWQRAVTMLHLGKVEVVRTYRRMLRAVTWRVHMPAVVRLVKYVRRHRARISFSRRNIFLRDGQRCQYCQRVFPLNELTCDHVIPRSRGGRSSWDNVVAACGPCNRKKSDRTPSEARMALARKPVRPSSLPALAALRLGAHPPEPWREFLPKSPQVG